MPRHITIKLPKAKDREKNVKAAREKQHFSCGGKTIQTTVAFSSEKLEVETIFFKCGKKHTNK